MSADGKTSQSTDPGPVLSYGVERPISSSEVAVFTDIVEAQLARHRLDAAGIQVFLSGENAARIGPYVGPQRVELMVATADAPAARGPSSPKSSVRAASVATALPTRVQTAAIPRAGEVRHDRAPLKPSCSWARRY